MAALDPKGQWSQEIQQPEPRYPEIVHIYLLHIYLTEVGVTREYNWPVISDMNRPITVHVMLFGCDKQCVRACVCVCVVLGVNLM